MRAQPLLLAAAFSLFLWLPAHAEPHAPLPALPLPTDSSAPEPPLLPDEIRFQPLAPEPEPVLPRYKLKLAQDAATPVLPPLELTSPEATLSVSVKSFVFSGNTVFSTPQLLAVVAKYSGREITGDELEQARIDLTRLYVDAGYLNSGAILPDQDVASGVIQLQIVEGQLTDIDLSGNRWFRSWWLRSQLRQAAGAPVNFYHLRTGLQLLRQNPGISRINAELKPGAQPGESILHAVVKDEHPFRLDLEVSNKRPPSVGEGLAELHFADLNLLGINDPLDLRWGVGHGTKTGQLDDSGFDNASGSYEFPVSPWGTSLGFHLSKNDSLVIDETFAALGITSKSLEYGLSLRQSLLQTLGNSVAFTVSADRKHSQTFLLARPFTLSPGAINGASDVFVTRLTLEWSKRTQLDVFSIRTTLNLGLHALGSSRADTPISATTGDTVPDSKFTSWLGQAQYVRRIFDTTSNRARPNTTEWNILRESVLLFRSNAQLSQNALLSMEQFSLGGSQSVRGYRENQLLRDNGLFASIELRVPIWMRSDKTPVVSLAPFFDFGTGWDRGKANDGSQSISSAGLGLLLSLSKHAQASLYCGHPFVSVQKDKNSLQDYGIHFTISVSAF